MNEKTKAPRPLWSPHSRGTTIVALPDTWEGHRLSTLPDAELGSPKDMRLGTRRFPHGLCDVAFFMREEFPQAPWADRRTVV